MDWFAVASWGVFPTPTPSGARRAAYAVSYGLLGTMPSAAANVAARDWLLRFGYYSHYR